MTRIPCMLLAVLAVAVAAADRAYARAYATDDRGGLFRVFPEDEKFERIGTVKVTRKSGEKPLTYTPVLTDIALSDIHGLYGISYGELFKINMRDPEKSQRVGALGPGSGNFNALVFDAAGALYALSGDTLYRVDLEKGAAQRIGAVGSGGYSDGDLAFIDGVLYGTFSRSDGSHLVRIDAKTGKGKDIGVIHIAAKSAAPTTPKERDAGETSKPVHSVWGLVWDGHKAWALTQAGHVLELDPKTARATSRFRAPITFHGACPMLRL